MQSWPLRGGIPWHGDLVCVKRPDPVESLVTPAVTFVDGQRTDMLNAPLIRWQEC